MSHATLMSDDIERGSPREALARRLEMAVMSVMPVMPVMPAMLRAFRFRALAVPGGAARG